jgi:large subunit ribosomal protein L14
MFMPLSRLEVADNSGALEIGCIGIVGPKMSKGVIGDILVSSVKRSRFPGKKGKDQVEGHGGSSKVQRGTVVRSVVVRSKAGMKRSSGEKVTFSTNAAVLLKGKSKEPLGSRVSGPICRELRSLGFTKVASLSSFLV